MMLAPEGKKPIIAVAPGPGARLLIRDRGTGVLPTFASEEASMT
jgi:hypothetical protein